MSCNIDHHSNSVLASLPIDQGGSGRHKCAGCAYKLGFSDGFYNRLMRTNFDDLPDSQAGIGRHKDVEEAYKLGYALGQSKR